MARSGNRRRRVGSSSFHSHSDPQHDINITNSNNGDAITNNGSIRQNHGIGISGNNGSAFDRFEDENHRKENKSRDGNERPKSERRHQQRPHHQHPAIHQRWEGKEITSHVNEEGKVSKFQDYALYLASRAKELKEEGNRRFQRKDYVGAMEQYDLALKLTLQDHPDRAIFHSNRAACLMQMKPVNYEEAVRECSLALDVHPGFGRALLRRARAYEALGKLDLALDDVESLLKSDMTHPDALEMEIRIRGLLGDHYHHRGDDRVPQQDLQESTPHSSSRLVQTPSSSSSQMMQTPPSSHHMVHTNADEIPLFRRMFNDPFRRQSSSATSSGCPKTETFERTVHSDNGQVSNSQGSKSFEMLTSPPVQPLKLIYDHDIRLAEMPLNCKFRDLRKIVQDTFPSAKAVLLKYKDIEGDLVTITSTKELRLAEVASAMRSQRNVGTPMQHSTSNESHEKSTIGSLVIDQLRLHVVDVPPEQEPYDREEASLVDVKEFSITAHNKGISEVTSSIEQKGDYSKEKEEHDKWLSDFADLFRVHLGIDATRGIDLHNIGIDFCSEALEEVASTEEAHKLFESHDTKDEEVDFCDRLQEAFDWAEAQYALAEEKFKQSLHVKPDFCDAMLSLGQKDFERAKLKWSLAIANQTDLSTWDSSKMLELFHNAEERMNMAALILEQYSREEGHDSDKGLRSHIYLLWGNILYEHSQVGYRLGLTAWKELLDASVEKFELAGAPSVDIDTALQRHLSNSALPPDVIRQEYAQDEEDIAQEIIQDENFVQESVRDDHFIRQNIKEENDIVPEKPKIAPNDDDKVVHVEIQGTDQKGQFLKDIRQNVKEENDIVPENPKIAPNDDDKGVNVEIQGTDQKGQFLKDDRNVEMEKIADIGQLLNNDDNVEKVGNDDIELHLNTKSAGSHGNEANHNMQDFANESTNGKIDLLCNGFNGRMEESMKKHIPLSNEEESMKNHPQVSGNQEENLRSFEVISSNDVIGPSDNNSNNGQASITMVQSQVSGNQGEKSRSLEEEMILNSVDKIISLNDVIDLSDKNLNNSQPSVTMIQTSVKEHDVPKNLSGMDEKNYNGLIENGHTIKLIHNFATMID